MRARLTAAMLFAACSIIASAPASHAAQDPLITPTFHGLTPARLLDTRPGQTTIDSTFLGAGPVTAAGLSDVRVLGRGGVPNVGVGSVAVNITVTNPTLPSFLTAYATGQDRPTASNLNFVAGQTVANMAIVAVGTGGQIRLFNFAGSTDVIVDVLGWFPEGSSYTGLSPARLLDTRPSSPTVDGLLQTGTPVAAGGTLDVPVAGRGNVPATGVGSVALNVTVAGSTGSGFVTVFPAGTGKPTASNLNFTPGQVVPNMVIVPLSADGKVSLFNSAGSTDLIVDVLGWFPTGTSYTGLSPARLLETRAGLTTIDGQAQGGGQVAANASIDVPVLGRGGVPATGVGAVALNVTATGPSTSTYVTAYPTGAARPTASNINLVANSTVPNMVIVKVGTGGSVSLYNFAGSTDLVVDVLGWFPLDTVPPSTELISVASTAPPGNGVSGTASVSFDGRYVAFASLATNLVAGDTNGKTDVFVRDRVAGTTTRVSVASDGTQGDLASDSPSISADGRYVAFRSGATNLVATDTNGFSDVFVRDTMLNTTIIVSRALGGTQANGLSGEPSISADGKWVSFTSTGNNFGTLVLDSNAHNDVYRTNIARTFLGLASLTSGATISNGDSGQSSLSADGSVIAFASNSTDLVTGDTNAAVDVFRRDFSDATITKISQRQNGNQTNGNSANPSISGSGRVVVYQSDASNIVPNDVNGKTDVFYYDFPTQVTSPVSIGLDGAATDGLSQSATVSTNGRFIAFASDATNLVTGDTNGKRDLFTVDILNGGGIVRRSLAADGTQGNDDSHNAALSGDGRYMAWDSPATNFGSDANATVDEFLRDLGTH